MLKDSTVFFLQHTKDGRYHGWVAGRRVGRGCQLNGNKFQTGPNEFSYVGCVLQFCQALGKQKCDQKKRKERKMIKQGGLTEILRHANVVILNLQ